MFFSNNKTKAKSIYQELNLVLKDSFLPAIGDEADFLDTKRFQYSSYIIMLNFLIFMKEDKVAKEYVNLINENIPEYDRSLFYFMKEEISNAFNNAPSRLKMYNMIDFAMDEAGLIGTDCNYYIYLKYVIALFYVYERNFNKINNDEFIIFNQDYINKVNNTIYSLSSIPAKLFTEQGFSNEELEEITFDLIEYFYFLAEIMNKTYLHPLILTCLIANNKDFNYDYFERNISNYITIYNNNPNNNTFNSNPLYRTVKEFYKNCYCEFDITNSVLLNKCLIDILKTL